MQLLTYFEVLFLPEFTVVFLIGKAFSLKQEPSFDSGFMNRCTCFSYLCNLIVRSLEYNFAILLLLVMVRTLNALWLNQSMYTCAWNDVMEKDIESWNECFGYMRPCTLTPILCTLSVSLCVSSMSPLCVVLCSLPTSTRSALFSWFTLFLLYFSLNFKISNYHLRSNY